MINNSVEEYQQNLLKEQKSYSNDKKRLFKKINQLFFTKFILNGT